ncbi:MAG: LysM peptidoglycan-binding domain-containing protein [Anaerolineales bacterium]|nr:LysM peptidoglycan-binding domain-containing protein [Anaerolineales bacterium]
MPNTQSNKFFRLIAPLLTATFLLLTTRALLAQQEDPPPIPQVHVVADGENLTIIATQYGLTVEDLLRVNNLANGDVLFVGQELVIPGGSGEAVATLYTVQAGDTLATIAEQFNTTAVSLSESNRLINPNTPPPVGQTINLVSRTGSTAPQPVLGQPYLVKPGDSLLTIATSFNLSPTVIMAANQLAYPTYLFPGQRLRLPAATPYRDLPGDLLDVAIGPLPLKPGQTAVITLQSIANDPPTGQLGEQVLHFVPSDSGHMALIGLDAFTPPGNYPLIIHNGSQTSFNQAVQIAPSDYVTQFVTLPETLNALLDPTVRSDEELVLAPIFTQFTAERQWSGLFQTPVLSSTFVTARYGDSRSYNGNSVISYHSGVDFAGGIGTPVVAPANGTVVFSDVLEVRGLTIILNHGQGVMTSYSHLSESFVTLGQAVATGETIGAVGSSGLSNGPHLHWELRIHNVPVNALQWTERPFP